MRKTFFTVFILLALSVTASAQDTKGDKHPIDVFLSECTDSNWSTMGMIQCTDEASKKWDEEMNLYYNKLMNMLDEDAKEKLRASQREWVKFRDLEYESIGSMYSYIYKKAGGGTMYSLLSVGASMDVVKQRALDLKDKYDVIMEFAGSGEN